MYFRACRILMEFYTSDKRRTWKRYVWVRLFDEFQCCVVKKSKDESTETKRRFEKEAGILDSVKGEKYCPVFAIFPRALGDHDGVLLL